MVFERKYGAAAILSGIPLITKGGLDYKSNPTLATGDVKISKDDGAFTNITTLPTVTPASDTSVKVSLSATEMQAARVVIRFTDQTSPKEWEDQELIIETYGHVSAQNIGDPELLDASVASRSDFDVTTAAVTVGANNDKTGYALSSAGVQAIWDFVIETAGAVNWTAKKIMRIIFSFVAGKASGGGTATKRFRDAADTKDRITITTDAQNNRTSTTLDGD